jgi:hypothetical protein
VLGDQTLTVNFGLSGAVVLEAITITAAETPIVPRDQVTSKTTVTGQTIDQLPVDDPRQAINLQPGVVESGDALGLSIRGGRPGEAVVYVDGVPVRRLRTGASQLNVGTNATEEASVTTGALGAEFGDAQSGVISLITRSGGPRFQGNLVYETDEVFGNSISVGFNRFEGSLSGPIFGNLTGRMYRTTRWPGWTRLWARPSRSLARRVTRLPSTFPGSRSSPARARRPTRSRRAPFGTRSSPTTVRSARVGGSPTTSLRSGGPTPS